MLFKFSVTLWNNGPVDCISQVLNLSFMEISTNRTATGEDYAILDFLINNKN